MINVKITKITAQISKRDRYNVFVEDEFSFSLTGKDILEFQIYKNKDLTPEDVHKLKLNSIKNDLKDNAYLYLSSRPHSEKEVIIHLRERISKETFKNAHFTKEEKTTVLNEVIDDLKNKNYINDLEFAKWLIKNRNDSRNKKSKRAITSELQSKGINSEIISQLQDLFDDRDEFQNAFHLCQKKYDSLAVRNLDKFKLKQKLYSYLSYKGFHYETINAVIDSVMSSSYNRPS